MRFSLRRKKDEETSVPESKLSESYSRLGIFSPTVEFRTPDPLRECKRLAELEAIFIRSRKLESLEDVPYIVSQIREGNIILLDISRLNISKEQAQLELKRIIERIRGETRGYNADIALVNDDCIIVTPSFVRF